MFLGKEVFIHEYFIRQEKRAYLVMLDCWTAMLRCMWYIVDVSRDFQKSPHLENKSIKTQNY